MSTRIITDLDYRLGLRRWPVYMAIGDACPKCMRSPVGVAGSKKKARRALYRVRVHPCPHDWPRRLIAFASGSNVPAEFHSLGVAP